MESNAETKTAWFAVGALFGALMAMLWLGRHNYIGVMEVPENVRGLNQQKRSA